MKLVCRFCNVFSFDITEGDEASGLAPGTTIEEIPEDMRCPVCGKAKTFMEPLPEEDYAERRASYLEFLENRKRKMPSLKSLINRPG
jgi:rubredoxin